MLYFPETAPYGCDSARYSWCGDGLKIVSGNLFRIDLVAKTRQFEAVKNDKFGIISENGIPDQNPFSSCNIRCETQFVFHTEFAF